MIVVLRGHAKVVGGKALTCESNLRLIYLAQQHLPAQTWGLPPDKATAYALGNDMGWTASSEEVRYLGWDARGGGHPDMSGLSDAVFCFDDPEFDAKMKQVPTVTSFTAAGNIPSSSYHWYPQSDPQVIAACPYHHIAVREDTGEIVPWHADRQ
ncbi:MAG: hypothetical protein ACE149_11400 [Armatimonadota bacterium]